MSGVRCLDFRQRVGYEIALEAAFPGVACRSVEASTFGDGKTDWGVSLSGPLEVLAQHGLVDPALVASLPSCGTGDRGGLCIRRGKSVINLKAYWRSDDDDDDVEKPARDLEARILGAISPWRPKVKDDAP